MELITRVFPGAEVKTQGSSSLGQVIIKHNATTVIAVKQRDLFSKYREPAAPKFWSGWRCSRRIWRTRLCCRAAAHVTERRV